MPCTGWSFFGLHIKKRAKLVGLPCQQSIGASFEDSTGLTSLYKPWNSYLVEKNPMVESGNEHGTRGSVSNDDITEQSSRTRTTTYWLISMLLVSRSGLVKVDAVQVFHRLFSSIFYVKFQVVSYMWEKFGDNFLQLPSTHTDHIMLNASLSSKSLYLNIIYIFYIKIN